MRPKPFGLFGTGDDTEYFAHSDSQFLAWIDWQERAAIMEYDQWVRRMDAEASALQDAIAHLRGRNPLLFAPKEKLLARLCRLRV